MCTRLASLISSSSGYSGKAGTSGLPQPMFSGHTLVESRKEPRFGRHWSCVGTQTLVGLDTKF